MKRRTDFADFFNTYNATTKMMGGINESLQDARANEARNNATAQQTSTESNFGQQDPEAEYEGAGSDGQMTNAEAASFGVNVPEEDKTKGTGVNRLFGLGLDPKKWQSTAPTRDQKNAAGDQAKADYYRSVGRDDSADKLEDGLYKKNLRARDDMRFTREQKDWGIKDAEQKRAEEHREANVKIWAQSPQTLANVEFIQGMQAYEEYQAKKAQATSPDDVRALGPAPARPAMREIDPIEQAAFNAKVFDNDYKHGKVSPAQAAEFQKNMLHVRNEGYGQALTLAHAGGKIEDVAAEFKKYGKEAFDPSTVTDDKLVKRPDGQTTRVITFKGPDGKERSIDTLAKLEQLGQAEKITAKYFRGREDARADERIEIDRANASTRTGELSEARDQKVIAQHERALKPYADRVASAQQNYIKAMESVAKDNPGAKTEDIESSPIVKAAKAAARDASAAMLRADASAWVRSGGQVGTNPEFHATKVLAGAKGNPAAVLQSLEEMKGVLGADYTAQVEGAIAGSEAWSKIKPKNAAPSAGAPAKPGYGQESALRSTASGNMGADPAYLRNDIAEINKVLKTVKDPAALDDLQTELAFKTRQLERAEAGFHADPRGPASGPPQNTVQAANPAAPGAPAAGPKPTSVWSGTTKTIEPVGRTEYVQMQEAMQRGFEPVGRGNGGLFGKPEILYKNTKTGESVWASKIFGN